MTRRKDETFGEHMGIRPGELNMIVGGPKSRERLESEQARLAEIRDVLQLADEAEIAACEHCNKESPVDKGVCCESCGAFNCRGRCWNTHWCGHLTDYHGRLVKVGDRLRYMDNPRRVLTITAMEHTFEVGGVCHGDYHGAILPMRPRLMELF